jgi:hypothetical protein
MDSDVNGTVAYVARVYVNVDKSTRAERWPYARERSVGPPRRFTSAVLFRSVAATIDVAIAENTFLGLI